MSTEQEIENAARIEGEHCGQATPQKNEEIPGQIQVSPAQKSDVSTETEPTHNWTIPFCDQYEIRGGQYFKMDVKECLQDMNARHRKTEMRVHEQGTKLDALDEICQRLSAANENFREGFDTSRVEHEGHTAAINILTTEITAQNGQLNHVRNTCRDIRGICESNAERITGLTDNHAVLRSDLECLQRREQRAGHSYMDKVDVPNSPTPPQTDRNISSKVFSNLSRH